MGDHTDLQKRDLSEIGVAICKFLIDQDTHGKRVTIRQMVDQWRKKKSTIPIPDKTFTRDDCERTLIAMLMGEMLKEVFSHTAYSTNSYLAVNPPMSDMLCDGDLILEINFKRVSKMKRNANPSLLRHNLSKNDGLNKRQKNGIKTNNVNHDSNNSYYTINTNNYNTKKETENNKKNKSWNDSGQKKKYPSSKSVISDSESDWST